MFTALGSLEYYMILLSLKISIKLTFIKYL